MLKANDYQGLAEHSFLVGEFAVAIAKNLGLFNINQHFNVEFSESLFRLAGYFHDIGKIDNEFQKFIETKSKDVTFDSYQMTEEEGEFSFENHPRHNELSFALLISLISKKHDNCHKLQLKNVEEFDIIKYAIYWHHAIPLRKKAFSGSEDSMKCFSEEQKRELYDNFSLFLSELDELSLRFTPNFKIDRSVLSPLNDFLFADAQNNPIFKDCSNLKIENKRTLLRAVLITADRVVSSLKDKIDSMLKDKNEFSNIMEDIIGEMELFKNNSVKFELPIEKMLTSFYPESERSLKQREVAESLISKRVSVLQGPAGVGKTKIALEWVKNLKEQKEKIFWICPRVTICQAIVEELKDEYVPDLKIQLLTGSSNDTYQNGVLLESSTDKFQGDIVVTTIDQICTTFLSHDNIDIALMIAKSTLIFDEYHEFFNIEGVEALFREIIEIKKILNEGNTLLVSATPNYFFLGEILFKDYPYNLCSIETFNKKPFSFNFVSCEDIKTSEMFDTTENNIIVFNTATNAQKSYLNLKSSGKDENCLIAHSKMSSLHKHKTFSKILDNFGKDKKSQDYKVLRAGPIVQASLNISSDKVLTEISNAENFLQRAGRCNRFGLSDHAEFITFYEQAIISNEKSEQLKILQLLGTAETTKAWLNYLLSRNISTIELNDIYQIYQEFHGTELAKDAYRSDYNKTQSRSIEILKSNFFAPKMMYYKKPRRKTNSLSSYSIRGSSSFYVSSIHIDINNPLVFDLLSNSDEGHLITLDYADVYKYVEKVGINNLVNNQKNGLAKSLPYTKKCDLEKIVKYARNAEYPIILSAKRDLIKDPNFMDYYVYITDKDIVVGLIKINKLLEIENIENIINLERI